MAKLMRIRDYILLSSAIMGDFLTEVHNVGEIMPNIMKMRYGFVPPNYKKTSYIATVSRLLKIGDIEKKIDQDGNQYLELTSSGKSDFKRRFPILTNIKSKWDGYFMVVIFDIPEKDRAIRDTLRYKFKDLGFGQLQESVWISPYHFEEDLRDFIETHGLGNRVFVLTAKKLLGGNVEELIEKTWHLDEIKKGYQKILKHIEVKKSPKEAWAEYLKVLKDDPLIPNAIYPMKELRDRVSKSLQIYSRS